ncbi:MAG: VOC family protein [Pleurocapsa sp. SU_196_0]|nr:VOC family protein [Pleurocapsa sp. SU_196_0]
MSKLRPYLGFDGQCQEAMTFYHGILGGNLEVQLVKDSPTAAHMPPEMQDKVIHAALTAPDFILLASDMSGARDSSERVSLMVECSSDEEIKRFFQGLSDGANVTQPLMESFWGSTFGHLTDKYGIYWMFNHTTA